MPITCTETALPGVLLVETEVFTDERGFFMETYHASRYADAGFPPVAFVQDNYSHSRAGVLRGLHYQLATPQDKLVYAVRGEIFDVAVDIRSGSPFFGRWTGHVLSALNRRQMFIPKGFAHGFCVLSETADVFYKCTDVYAPGDEYGILWSDADIGVSWPVPRPLLSSKDAGHPMLAATPREHLPIYPDGLDHRSGAGPAHFFRPGKNSPSLEQLAGLPKTRRPGPGTRSGSGKAGRKLDQGHPNSA